MMVHNKFDPSPPTTFVLKRLDDHGNWDSRLEGSGHHTPIPEQGVRAHGTGTETQFRLVVSGIGILLRHQHSKTPPEHHQGSVQVECKVQVGQSRTYYV